MTDKPKKKTKSPEAATPEKEFEREGITISIYRRQAPSGYQYPTLKLSRKWKTQGGKELSSDEWFVENEESIIAAIRDACAYTRADKPSES